MMVIVIYIKQIIVSLFCHRMGTFGSWLSSYQGGKHGHANLDVMFSLSPSVDQDSDDEGVQ